MELTKLFPELKEKCSFSDNELVCQLLQKMIDCVQDPKNNKCSREEMTKGGDEFSIFASHVEFMHEFDENRVFISFQSMEKFDWFSKYKNLNDFKSKLDLQKEKLKVTDLLPDLKKCNNPKEKNWKFEQPCLGLQQLIDCSQITKGDKYHPFLNKSNVCGEYRNIFHPDIKPPYEFDYFLDELGYTSHKEDDKLYGNFIGKRIFHHSEFMEFLKNPQYTNKK